MTSLNDFINVGFVELMLNSAQNSHQIGVVNSEGLSPSSKEELKVRLQKDELEAERISAGFKLLSNDIGVFRVQISSLDIDSLATEVVKALRAKIDDLKAKLDKYTSVSNMVDNGEARQSTISPDIAIVQVHSQRIGARVSAKISGILGGMMIATGFLAPIGLSIVAVCSSVVVKPFAKIVGYSAWCFGVPWWEHQALRSILPTSFWYI